MTVDYRDPIDHHECTQDQSAHNCSCHLSPPCSGCETCPAWDDETESK